MQQRVILYTLDLVWCWVLTIVSLKITSAAAVAGFRKHKRHSCWNAKLDHAAFAAFEEYLVTLNTCQSVDWRACTALICKHAEQASHQVEDGLNTMLAAEVCLFSAHADAKTNRLKDYLGRQRIKHYNA